MSDGVKSITIQIGDETVDVRREADGLRAYIDRDCPKCGAKGPTQIGGKNMRIAGHDTYESDGAALCCMTRLGVITTTVSTLFGLEADEAMTIRGKWRVF